MHDTQILASACKRLPFLSTSALVLHPSKELRVIIWLDLLQSSLPPQKWLWQFGMRQHTSNPFDDCAIHSLRDAILFWSLWYYHPMPNSLTFIVFFEWPDVLTTIVRSDIFERSFLFLSSLWHEIVGRHLQLDLYFLKHKPKLSYNKYL